MKAKFIYLICILIVLACNKNEDNIPKDPENMAPADFDLIGVSNNETNVDLTPDFSWETATDPDGDSVTYDLLLETDPNPDLVYANDLSKTFFQIQDRLHLATDYYWRVTATDANGKFSQSAIYKFTTRNLSFPNKPVAANANFSGRAGHSSVVFDNKIWVIGGSGSDNDSDVWYSKNGGDWTQATASAPFTARASHTTITFNDKIWVIGGREETGGDFKNDVWYSDDGENWTQATAAAAFSARRSFATVVFDDKIWIIGGEDGQRKNDLWYSSDGENWTQLTAAAAFSERLSHTTAVFDDKLWVIGGNDGNFKNDIWYSKDGGNWMQATDSAPFTPRNGHTTAVFNNRIWVIGGYDFSFTNDVWAMD